MVKAKDLEINDDWWIVADTHFGHDNIVRLCDRPPEHEKLMFTNWSDRIGPDDQVLHLGDLCYKGGLKWRLPGNKYLLRGNHDRKDAAWYKSRGFEVLEETEIEPYQSRSSPDVTKYKHGFFWDAPDGTRVLFSHFPDGTVGGWKMNIHGHIHNNGYPEWVSFVDERMYVNVSVEETDYSPVKLKEILGRYEA